MTRYCWTFTSESNANADLNRINNYLNLNVTLDNGYKLDNVDTVKKVDGDDKWYFDYVTKTFLGTKPSILNDLVQHGIKEEYSESWVSSG